MPPLRPDYVPNDVSGGTQPALLGDRDGWRESRPFPRWTRADRYSSSPHVVVPKYLHDVSGRGYFGVDAEDMFSVPTQAPEVS